MAGFYRGVTMLKTSLSRAVISRSFSGSAKRCSDTVGFIGLGNMGSGMARNLLKNNCKVIVNDLSPEAVKSLEADGAQSASTPAQVASQAKTIVTMLPAGPHVTEVYTNPSTGILSAVQEGSLLLDSSTTETAVSVSMKEAAEKKGAVFMDSPVSGGILAAQNALLTFLVGGPESHFEQASSILSNMGKNVIHCGDVGTGQAAKICNNMLLGSVMIATSETMQLAQKMGLDPKLMAQVLNCSSGQSWCTEKYNPCPGVMEGVPASRNYEGGFMVALMAKDLGLAQSAATSVKSPTPMGSLAHQIYRVMANTEKANKDFGSVYLFLGDQNKQT